MRISYGTIYCFVWNGKSISLKQHRWYLRWEAWFSSFCEIIPKHFCKTLILWLEEVLMTLWLLLCVTVVTLYTFFFPRLIYSRGRPTLDAVSTCTISWQHTVFEEREESTSCRPCDSPALLWHIFGLLYLTDISCSPADEGWACGQLTPAWRRINFWGL